MAWDHEMAGAAPAFLTMRKMINWGTPKYIQQEAEFKKYQYEEREIPRGKKKKYCIKTKGAHIFSETKPNTSDWWYNSWLTGEWKEYRCLCGKKKIEWKREYNSAAKNVTFPK